MSKYPFIYKEKFKQTFGLLIILFGIAVGIYLVQEAQIFQPKAYYNESTDRPPPAPKKPPFIGRFAMPASGLSKQEKIAIAVSSLQAKKDLIELYYGKSNKKIPNGLLVDDRPGKNPYDKKWSFHFDPDTVQFAEVAIELCDARPSFVQANLDQWLRDVKRYCPWDLQLSSIDKVKPLKKIPKSKVCTQVITTACLNMDKRICIDFANPCEVPGGWTIQKDPKERN